MNKIKNFVKNKLLLIEDSLKPRQLTVEVVALNASGSLYPEKI